jgi:putative glycosyltransferase (TIGR04348 family)
MDIALITPERPVSHSGNRNTAQRWAAMLRALGHRVRVAQSWDGRPADLMLALHARRSHDSIRRYALAHPWQPLVVALTGTDLYRDIDVDASAQHSLELATRLIVLQDMAPLRLPRRQRKKCRVVYQSTPPIPRAASLTSCFEVCVSGHLREVKDPFRAAAAAVYLPRTSRIRITQIGGAMSTAMAREAQAWMEREARYRWRGEVTHGRALKLLARARLMVISSQSEGGANVVSEALAANVPVLASRIAGNIGMLGRDYAGYYPYGDERALARLLSRAESDPEFYRRLTRQCARRKPLISARREMNALRKLIAELE